jgi:NCS1 family nucleobase:cation symporter-1
MAVVERSVVEAVTGEGPDPAYCNADLAPTTPAERTWRLWNFAALWVALAACIPTYMLASSLIEEGMNWWQAVLTIFLGNAIVLVPMVLNAHAGTRYGIPFPVYCRASFGLRGANLPALLRAVVACGWFGIQTWIGGWAIYQIAALYLAGLRDYAPLPLVGISAPQLVCFLLFWGVNVLVVWRGSIRSACC